MIWPGEYSREWQRHFALFPTSVEQGTKVVWLGFYWKRYVPGPLLCEKCQLAREKMVIGHWETTAYNPFHGARTKEN